MSICPIQNGMEYLFYFSNYDMAGIYNPMKYEISQYSISSIQGSGGRFNRLREDDYIFVIRPGQNSA